MKRVIPRPQAERDLDTALSHYAKENPTVARDFLGEVNGAYDRIHEMPGLGSPHFSCAVKIDNLRAYSLYDFPYIIFYFERENYIDVVRILHSSRDVFGILLGLK